MDTNTDPYALISVDDSVLVVIDVQDAFLRKLPHEDNQRLLNNICWIVRLASWKQVPLIVTAWWLSVLSH
jgi:nicotinamidase-related amidase